jgi:hypothetical protein
VKQIGLTLLLLIAALAVPATGICADHGFSIGYGVAALCPHLHIGRIEGGSYFDFFQATYLYERPCGDYRRLAVFFEPFAVYVNRPHENVDLGFYTGLKYYPFDRGEHGLFFSAGTGMAYTTMKFQEQGTHLLFTLEASVGYRFGRFYVEDMMRHYSNGATTSPNRSVHANILSVGVYF